VGDAGGGIDVELLILVFRDCPDRTVDGLDDPGAVLGVEPAVDDDGSVVVVIPV
jgi:hypothetical protein